MKFTSLIALVFVIFTSFNLFAENINLELSFTMSICDNMSNQCTSETPDFKQISIPLKAHKKDPNVLVGQWHKQLLSGPYTFNAYLDVTKTLKGYELDIIVDSYKENPIDELTSVSGGVFVEKLEDLNRFYIDGHWQFDMDKFMSYAPTLRVNP